MNAAIDQVEIIIYHFAEWCKLGIELIAVLIIVWGVLMALWQHGGKVFNDEERDYADLRLCLARYLIIALEFQLAADILSTAIAPGWSEIGKLGAIAVIRTVLNYFLEKELSEKLRSGSDAVES